jgi:DNA polymerase-3 subunit delta
MKLSLDALGAHLAERLLPVYLVSGDEPLLMGEALDAIRARARASGFSEREVFFIERASAVWETILSASQALSLLASRRMIEIRMPGGKPGTSGAQALLQALRSAGDDLLILIVTDRLDRDAQAAEWVRVATERGAWLPIWPVERARLPQWLRARLAAAGLTATPEALQLLAERSEGNLLAARQEIDKLALLVPAGTRLTLAEVVASSADSARFDVFQLGDAVRSREAPRALRILGSLRAEGAEPTLVLWALLREQRAQPTDRPARTARLIARSAAIDRMIKGIAEGDPWDELTWLAAELCGVPSAPPPPRAPLRI